MSDGFHDDPYACLQPPKQRVKAKVAAKSSPTGGPWFACSNCDRVLPFSLWAFAHLPEKLFTDCQCGVRVSLPTKLPKG